MTRVAFQRFLAIACAMVAVGAAGSASSHQYIDYFEAGETHLSPQGYRVAREVAAYAALAPSTILIVAHEDGYEATTRADDHLDVWRAREMMLELVRLGVPFESIRIEARGATQLARATAEGAAEPLNRRVTVDINRVQPAQPGEPVPPAPTGHLSQPRIYFDRGSTAIDRNGLFALQLAVLGAEPDKTLVWVRGGTDTSGSPGTNQDLSLRRAEAVARALVTFGIPWDAIRITAGGEQPLGRATADGVAEPRNRVVTVDVRPRNPPR